MTEFEKERQVTEQPTTSKNLRDPNFSEEKLKEVLLIWKNIPEGHHVGVSQFASKSLEDGSIAVFGKKGRTLWLALNDGNFSGPIFSIDTESRRITKEEPVSPDSTKTKVSDATRPEKVRVLQKLAALERQLSDPTLEGEIIKGSIISSVAQTGK